MPRSSPGGHGRHGEGETTGPAGDGSLVERSGGGTGRGSDPAIVKLALNMLRTLDMSRLFP